MAIKDKIAPRNEIFYIEIMLEREYQKKSDKSPIKSEMQIEENIGWNNENANDYTYGVESQAVAEDSEGEVGGTGIVIGKEGSEFLGNDPSLLQSGFVVGVEKEEDSDVDSFVDTDEEEGDYTYGVESQAVADWIQGLKVDSQSKLIVEKTLKMIDELRVLREDLEISQDQRILDSNELEKIEESFRNWAKSLVILEDSLGDSIQSESYQLLVLYGRRQLNREISYFEEYLQHKEEKLRDVLYKEILKKIQKINQDLEFKFDWKTKESKKVIKIRQLGLELNAGAFNSEKAEDLLRLLAKFGKQEMPAYMTYSLYASLDSITGNVNWSGCFEPYFEKKSMEVLVEFFKNMYLKLSKQKLDSSLKNLKKPVKGFVGRILLEVKKQLQEHSRIENEEEQKIDESEGLELERRLDKSIYINQIKKIEKNEGRAVKMSRVISEVIDFIEGVYEGRNYEKSFREWESLMLNWNQLIEYLERERGQVNERTRVRIDRLLRQFGKVSVKKFLNYIENELEKQKESVRDLELEEEKLKKIEVKQKEISLIREGFKLSKLSKKDQEKGEREKSLDEVLDLLDIGNDRNLEVFLVLKSEVFFKKSEDKYRYYDHLIVPSLLKMEEYEEALLIFEPIFSKEEILKLSDKVLEVIEEPQQKEKLQGLIKGLPKRMQVFFKEVLALTKERQQAWNEIESYERKFVEKQEKEEKLKGLEEKVEELTQKIMEYEDKDFLIERVMIEENRMLKKAQLKENIYQKQKRIDEVLFDLQKEEGEVECYVYKYHFEQVAHLTVEIEKLHEEMVKIQESPLDLMQGKCLELEGEIKIMKELLKKESENEEGIGEVIEDYLATQEKGVSLSQLIHLKQSQLKEFYEERIEKSQDFKRLPELEKEKKKLEEDLKKLIEGVDVIFTGLKELYIQKSRAELRLQRIENQLKADLEHSGEKLSKIYQVLQDNGASQELLSQLKQRKKIIEKIVDMKLDRSKSLDMKVKKKLADAFSLFSKRYFQENYKEYMEELEDKLTRFIDRRDDSDLAGFEKHWTQVREVIVKGIHQAKKENLESFVIDLESLYAIVGQQAFIEVIKEKKRERIRRKKVDKELQKKLNKDKEYKRKLETLTKQHELEMINLREKQRSLHKKSVYRGEQEIENEEGRGGLEGGDEEKEERKKEEQVKIDDGWIEMIRNLQEEGEGIFNQVTRNIKKEDTLQGRLDELKQKQQLYEEEVEYLQQRIKEEEKKVMDQFDVDRKKAQLLLGGGRRVSDKQIDTYETLLENKKKAQKNLKKVQEEDQVEISEIKRELEIKIKNRQEQKIDETENVSNKRKLEEEIIIVEQIIDELSLWMEGDQWDFEVVNDFKKVLIGHYWNGVRFDFLNKTITILEEIGQKLRSHEESEKEKRMEKSKSTLIRTQHLENQRVDLEIKQAKEQYKERVNDLKREYEDEVLILEKKYQKEKGEVDFELTKVQLWYESLRLFDEELEEIDRVEKSPLEELEGQKQQLQTRMYKLSRFCEIYFDVNREEKIEWLKGQVDIFEKNLQETTSKEEVFELEEDWKNIESQIGINIDKKLELKKQYKDYLRNSYKERYRQEVEEISNRMQIEISKSNNLKLKIKKILIHIRELEDQLGLEIGQKGPFKEKAAVEFLKNINEQRKKSYQEMKYYRERVEDETKLMKELESKSILELEAHKWGNKSLVEYEINRRKIVDLSFLENNSQEQLESIYKIYMQKIMIEEYQEGGLIQYKEVEKRLKDLEKRSQEWDRKCKKVEFLLAEIKLYQSTFESFDEQHKDIISVILKLEKRSRQVHRGNLEEELRRKEYESQDHFQKIQQKFEKEKEYLLKKRLSYSWMTPFFLSHMGATAKREAQSLDDIHKGELNVNLKVILTPKRKKEVELSAQLFLMMAGVSLEEHQSAIFILKQHFPRLFYLILEENDVSDRELGKWKTMIYRASIDPIKREESQKESPWLTLQEVDALENIIKRWNEESQLVEMLTQLELNVPASFYQCVLMISRSLGFNVNPQPGGGLFLTLLDKNQEFSKLGNDTKKLIDWIKKTGQQILIQRWEEVDRVVRFNIELEAEITRLLSEMTGENYQDFDKKINQLLEKWGRNKKVVGEWVWRLRRRSYWEEEGEGKFLLYIYKMMIQVENSWAEKIGFDLIPESPSEAEERGLNEMKIETLEKIKSLNRIPHVKGEVKTLRSLENKVLHRQVFCKIDPILQKLGAYNIKEENLEEKNKYLLMWHNYPLEEKSHSIGKALFPPVLNEEEKKILQLHMIPLVLSEKEAFQWRKQKELVSKDMKSYLIRMEQELKKESESLERRQVRSQKEEKERLNDRLKMLDDIKGQLGNVESELYLNKLFQQLYQQANSDVVSFFRNFMVLRQYLSQSTLFVSMEGKKQVLEGDLDMSVLERKVDNEIQEVSSIIRSYDKFCEQQRSKSLELKGRLGGSFQQGHYQYLEILIKREIGEINREKWMKIREGLWEVKKKFESGVQSKSYRKKQNYMSFYRKIQYSA